MSSDLYTHLMTATLNANAAEVQRLMVLDPTIDGSAALQVAAGQGHVDIVQLLMRVSDPLFQESQALFCALQHNTKCVQLLAPVSKIGARHFFMAVDSGCWDSVATLMGEQHDPDLVQQSFVRAARFGQVNILKHLVGCVDPTYKNSLALQWALLGNHEACVDILYPVSDTPAVVAHFEQDKFPPAFLENVKRRMDADRLWSVVGEVSTRAQSARKI